MKNILQQSLFFSYPERKALSTFFTILGVLISGHYAFNSLFPPKLPDNSMYVELFDEKKETTQKLISPTKGIESSILVESTKKVINSSPPKKAKRVLIKMDEEDQSQQLPSMQTDEYNAESRKSEKKDSIIIDKRKNIIKVDINTAEEYELQYLKGIGPSYASRIVKYRNMLGGFYSIDQLKEVYGMDSSLFDKLVPFIFISGKVKELPVDQENPPFFRHPYLTYQQAKIIRAYIMQHGPLDKPEDLLKIKIVTQETVDKIKPYLPF
jgi:competence ComEA-like helix-hairpin-helix protein